MICSLCRCQVPPEGITTCHCFRCPQVRKQKPTFDEWFLKKYFHTFEELHCNENEHIAHAMMALTRYLREYTTEMVRWTDVRF